MVVDTSVWVAIVLGEEDAEALLGVLLGADEVLVPAATLTEALIVVEARGGPEATQDLRLLLTSQRAQVVAVDHDDAELAAAAWRRFGKGRHPAALNYGDCFSYALARRLGVPLLFKGRDLAQTDVRSALPS